jgi:hypothetical protein
MFRLPSLPSVPGLSSDPPKLAFRNAANGLARLSRQVNFPAQYVPFQCTDESFWNAEHLAR